MSILIVRHGETLLNVARVLQPADTALSEHGLAQAAAVARRLAGCAAVRIVSSPLPRARTTAEAIARETGLPIDFEPLLQERNFGDLRGQRYDDLGFDPLTMEAAPPGGESAAEFRARVAQAFVDVVARRAVAGGPLIVVSHGLVIREWLLASIALAPGTDVPVHLANAGLTVVDAAPPHAASLVDGTRHLAAVADDPRGLSGG